jgi:hypothetical protein
MRSSPYKCEEAAPARATLLKKAVSTTNQDACTTVTPLRVDVTSNLQHVEEFVSLLEVLGSPARHRGQHSIRCWAHEDRSPSLSVNPSRCVWYCHGCATGGGLRELRDAAGIRTETRGGAAPLGALDRLASPGSDPLRMIPVEVLEEFRRVTGRHRRDTVLSDNLRRLLASIHARCTETQHTYRVRYSATDALAYGMRAELWQDVIALRLRLGNRTAPLISWLGIEVTVGESGRRCRAGSGKGGAFRSTEITLGQIPSISLSEYPSLDGRRSEEGKKNNMRGIPNSLTRISSEATLAASLAAARPRGSVPTLARRRAVALLLADLAFTESEIPVSGGQMSHPGTRLRADLVGRYGKRIQRTIRHAEEHGWVTVARIGSEALVGLTEAGLLRLESDIEIGRTAAADRVHRVQRVWAETQKQIIENRRTARRRIACAHLGGMSTPWIPFGPDQVRHYLTGEVTSLSNLRK